LAYWLSVKKKKKVLLVDADSQKSSSQWIDGMDQQISVSILQSPDEILEQLPDLTRNYEYVIVDGPASLSEATRAILFRCDVAVIPTQPTGVDLRSASDAMRLVKQAQSVRGGLPKALIFFSRAVKGTNLNQAVRLRRRSNRLPTNCLILMDCVCIVLSNRKGNSCYQ
jgi:chromosome partitioning protein